MAKSTRTRKPTPGQKKQWMLEAGKWGIIEIGYGPCPKRGGPKIIDHNSCVNCKYCQGSGPMDQICCSHPGAPARQREIFQQLMAECDAREREQQGRLL